MDIFVKTTAAVLMTAVICIVLAKQSKDYSLLLIITVCCMVLGVAYGYLEKVFAFMETLNKNGKLNTDLIAIMFKATGIGLMSELASMICQDSGNAALGKALQVLSSAIILWLCIPLFTELIQLIEGVLSAL